LTGIGLSRSDAIFILTLCFSESSLDYSAVHQGRYTNICGVDPLWKDYLKERNVPYNSLQAGWEIFLYYYEKNNHNKLKAILEFKGVEKNAKVKAISKKIITITNTIKKD
jgi:hypothetical protein